MYSLGRLEEGEIDGVCGSPPPECCSTSDGHLRNTPAGVSHFQLQVWTRMASDWHEDIGFLPLARGGRALLRLMELEVGGSEGVCVGGLLLGYKSGSCLWPEAGFYGCLS